MKAWRLVEPPVAVLAGVIAAYGFPPHSHGWLLSLALVAFALRLPLSSPRSAAFLGWLFGTAWQFTALTWVSEAFLVAIPGLGLAALGPVFGLSAGLGLFAATAIFLWRKYWPGADVCTAGSFLGLAVALSFAEWCMGHVLTGFPWAIASLAFVETRLAHAGAYVGAYGISLLLYAAPLAFFGAAATIFRTRRIGIGSFLIVAATSSALAAAWFAPEDPGAASEPGVDWPVIRIVQGNTPQREKWRPGNQTAIFANHMALSRAPAERPLAAIVWPETATPFPVNEAPHALSALGVAAPEGGYVILGAPLRSREEGGGYRHTNSLVAVDGDGAIVATYDKAHLVPGGEYVPFEDYLPIDKFVPGRGSFSPGPGIRTIALAGLPAFSPLICYEVIFPGAVALDDERPAFLLNITNDAWYGTSAGPYQHLAITRMRAIEEGLPLVRAANTGISAAFDGRGRELGRIPLEETGFIDIALPPPQPPTIYALYGDQPYFILLAVFSLAALLTCVAARSRVETALPAPDTAEYLTAESPARIADLRAKSSRREGTPLK